MFWQLKNKSPWLLAYVGLCIHYHFFLGKVCLSVDGGRFLFCSNEEIRRYCVCIFGGGGGMVPTFTRRILYEVLSTQEPANRLDRFYYCWSVFFFWCRVCWVSPCRRGGDEHQQRSCALLDFFFCAGELCMAWCFMFLRFMFRIYLFLSFLWFQHVFILIFYLEVLCSRYGWGQLFIAYLRYQYVLLDESKLS